MTSIRGTKYKIGDVVKTDFGPYKIVDQAVVPYIYGEAYVPYVYLEPIKKGTLPGRLHYPVSDLDSLVSEVAA